MDDECEDEGCPHYGAKHGHGQSALRVVQGDKGSRAVQGSSDVRRVLQPDGAGEREGQMTAPKLTEREALRALVGALKKLDDELLDESIDIALAAAREVLARPEGCDDEGCPHYGTAHGHVYTKPQCEPIAWAIIDNAGSILRDELNRLWVEESKIDALDVAKGRSVRSMIWGDMPARPEPEVVGWAIVQDGHRIVKLCGGLGFAEDQAIRANGERIRPLRYADE